MMMKNQLRKKVLIFLVMKMNDCNPFYVYIEQYQYYTYILYYKNYTFGVTRLHYTSVLYCFYSNIIINCFCNLNNFYLGYCNLEVGYNY